MWIGNITSKRQHSNTGEEFDISRSKFDLPVPVSGMSYLGQKWVILAEPKCTEIWKSLGFVPFGANLTHFGPKSDIATTSGPDVSPVFHGHLDVFPTVLWRDATVLVTQGHFLSCGTRNAVGKINFLMEITDSRSNHKISGLKCFSFYTVCKINI